LFYTKEIIEMVYSLLQLWSKTLNHISQNQKKVN